MSIERLNALGLILALALAGCAANNRLEQTTFVAASSPAPSATLDLPAPAEPSRLRTIFEGPEDFRCQDGDFIRLDYAPTRDITHVSLNGAPPVEMRRADDAGLVVYRHGDLTLYRSGPRIALSSATRAVEVRRGDTLGRIAERVYGDRRHAFDIARANTDQITNPDVILVGQVLRLPAIERRCRRTVVVESIATTIPARALQRRSFSPPSSDQPDQQPVRATALDRERREWARD